MVQSRTPTFEPLLVKKHKKNPRILAKMERSVKGSQGDVLVTLRNSTRGSPGSTPAQGNPH